MTKTILFIGSKRIGAQCLEHLISRSAELECRVVGVCTNARGMELRRIAETASVPVFDDVASAAAAVEYDLLISVQYHAILTQTDIDSADLLAVNLHMASLPEYRGANAFSRAIIDGARVFGTTIHEMTTAVDGGAILFEDRFEVPANIWVDELFAMTEARSIDLFRRSLPNLLSGEYSPVPQEELMNRGTSFGLRREIEALKSIGEQEISPSVADRIRATSMPGFEPPHLELNGRTVWLVCDGQMQDFADWYHASRDG